MISVTEFNAQKLVLQQAENEYLQAELNILNAHTSYSEQFMEGSTNCRFTLFADLHQSGNGIVPVTGQTQYFGHQPDRFQTEFLISQMMIAHDREVGVLMHSDNR